MKDFDLTAPLVQQKIRERFGKRLKTEEWVVSPGNIFDSEELMTVMVE